MSELVIQKLISEHPSFIEPELKLMKKEFKLETGGRVDFHFLDNQQRNLFVEIKVGRIKRSDIGQILEYWDSCRKVDINSRVMVICGAVNDSYRKVLSLIGIEIFLYKDIEQIAHLEERTQILEKRKNELKNKVTEINKEVGSLLNLRKSLDGRLGDLSKIIDFVQSSVTKEKEEKLLQFILSKDIVCFSDDDNPIEDYYQRYRLLVGNFYIEVIPINDYILGVTQKIKAYLLNNSWTRVEKSPDSNLLSNIMLDVKEEVFVSPDFNKNLIGINSKIEKCREEKLEIIKQIKENPRILIVRDTDINMEKLVLKALRKVCRIRKFYSKNEFCFGHLSLEREENGYYGAFLINSTGVSMGFYLSKEQEQSISDEILSKYNKMLKVEIEEI